MFGGIRCLSASDTRYPCVRCRVDMLPLENQAPGILGTGQHFSLSADDIQEIEAFLRNGEI